MGKKYHCSYCDKTMVSTPSIIKTHNKGIGHQRLVQEHYQQFKDPETILAEESKKKPCLRFIRGDCQFGGICRYSHYTKEHLDSFREYVAIKKSDKTYTPQTSFQDLYEKLQDEKSSKNPVDGNTVILDTTGLTHMLPWTYNDALDCYGENLPPSIKRLKTEDFSKANIIEWG